MIEEKFYLTGFHLIRLLEKDGFSVFRHKTHKIRGKKFVYVHMLKVLDNGEKRLAIVPRNRARLTFKDLFNIIGTRQADIGIDRLAELLSEFGLGWKRLEL